jgi:hypothetical protein
MGGVLRRSQAMVALWIATYCAHISAWIHGMAKDIYWARFTLFHMALWNDNSSYLFAKVPKMQRTILLGDSISIGEPLSELRTKNLGADFPKRIKSETPPKPVGRASALQNQSTTHAK